MGEINRDHEERTLRLVDSGGLKFVGVSIRKASDTCAEVTKDWEIDYADLIHSVQNRQVASSLMAM